MEKTIKFFIGAEDQDGQVFSKHYINVKWSKNIQKEFEDNHGHSKSLTSEILNLVSTAIKNNFDSVIPQIITDILTKKKNEIDYFGSVPESVRTHEDESETENSI